MKKWEYAHVVYQRKHNPGEFCIYGHETVMSDVDPISGLHVDRFLGAAGQRGWELTGTLFTLPTWKEAMEPVGIWGRCFIRCDRSVGHSVAHLQAGDLG